MHLHYDVVIVGGGMTGASLALALSYQTQGKIKIAVLEKQIPHQHHHGGFDARCIALSSGSCRHFNQILLPNKQSLWQLLTPLCEPIKHIHVSDRGHFGIAEFSAKEFCLAALGAVIELNQAGVVMMRAMQDCSNIDYFSPVSISSLERNVEQVNIQLEDHRTLSTHLLVGADGTQSNVASAVGITQELVREYQQTAIISNILVQQPHQNRAFERFTEEGPIALLPMKDNLMSLVWCVKNSQEIINLNDQQFLSRLQQRFGWRVGKLKECGKRFAYPLNLYKAAQHIQDRVALVGNACQTLHPVAGQGFNLGIRDVMSLANVVSQAYLQQQDWGKYQVLQNYAKQRNPDQRNIIGLTDGLVSIFANNLLPLQIGRNFGLMAFTQSSLLRQYFAKATLGWC
ncbi:2-octaprenyl-6-methoxyphenyl hydroxylase [Histophilus somni]|uniref:2-octaprenyl-6-methoxyphenyl hydroxylase n=1 Tax=Histophilus somni TaxID=731 RepID=UPI00201F6859|nr:2-octaprenyl-6-methoxyphenyl hydroxylase [Histophilus somni]